MNNDLIADKTEEVIGRMFSNFRSQEGGPTEYSMLYDPNKHPSWFIVIYFPDSNILKDAIKQGVCYNIYSYLLNEFNNDLEISKIDKSISFEYGNRPAEKTDIENALRQLIAKFKSQQKVAGKTDIKICGTCGHDFDKHQLLCNLVDDKVTPTEGWIMCPEENCNCFQTWGANYKMEDAKTTSKFKTTI
ncbi:MAG: hypothetical protein V4547_00065 [Bacteroidota bacterium]